jgi:addiction module RelB/DinJ family antitoxin
MSDITIRLDDDVRCDFEALAAKLGFSVSSAFDTLARRAIKEQELPVNSRTQSDKEYDEYFNSRNMKILVESIAQLERGDTITMTLAELEAMDNG